MLRHLSGLPHFYINKALNVCSKGVNVVVISPPVTWSKTVFGSGIHNVDSGFQILDFGFLYSIFQWNLNSTFNCWRDSRFRKQDFPESGLPYMGLGRVVVVQDCILVDLILQLHSYILCFLYWEYIFSLSLGRYQSQVTFLLKFWVPRFIITFTMMTWQFIQKLTNYVSWTYSILSPQWNEGKGRAIPPSILASHGPRIYLIPTDKRPRSDKRLSPRSEYHTSPAPLSYKRPLPLPYTLLNIRDTGKTCFYCHFIYNFLNFNYNIYTDTALPRISAHNPEVKISHKSPSCISAPPPTLNSRDTRKTCFYR